ncbi:MAG: hypothetical protein M3P33_03315 [bacterium]|nr:hypothetical protein [bacterium]
MIPKKAKLKELWANISKTIKLSCQIDKKLTIIYYTTAVIGALAPLIASYFTKLFLDSIISITQISSSAQIPFILIVLLGTYFTINLIEQTIYHGLNANYYDYLLRNKLQNGLMYMFVSKLGVLDLGHRKIHKFKTLLQKCETLTNGKSPS